MRHGINFDPCTEVQNVGYFSFCHLIVPLNGWAFHRFSSLFAGVSMSIKAIETNTFNAICDNTVRG
jgi:hypothetical protein